MSLAVWEDAWGRVPELPEIDAGLPPEGCATNARVGAYDAREFLGKGEFAKVHACVARRDARVHLCELALAEELSLIHISEPTRPY